MVIHTITKVHKACIIISILLSIFTGMIFPFSFGKEALPVGIGITFIMIISVVYHGIFFARTFVMDEKGCVIRAPWGERFYTWEEFAVKRLEEHIVSKGPRQGCKRGYVVFFSIYPVKKELRENPCSYWNHHPFSLTMFAFRFAIDKDDLFEPGYEEKYFREKMKEWNVELEEVRMRDWYKKR